MKEFGRKVKSKMSPKKRGKAREPENVAADPAPSMQRLNIQEEASGKASHERVSEELVQESFPTPVRESLAPDTIPGRSSGEETFQVPPTTRPEKLPDQAKPVLVYEHFGKTRSRTTEDLKNLEGCNTQGLKKTKMIGTEQFSAEQFAKLVASLEVPKIAVLDMRHESHGLIIGEPFSWWAKDNHNWANVGKNDAKIEEKEMKKILKLASRGDSSLDIMPKGYFKTGADKSDLPPLHIENLGTAKIQTERQLVEEYPDGRYYRFPVPDYARPSDEIVDQMVQVMRNEIAPDKDITLIVHCHGGMGRTTQAMTMYDMLHNAKDVSRAEIVDRQIKLRGREESKPTAPGKEHKAQFVKEKPLFLEAFYRYAKDYPIDHENPMGWLAWLDHMSSKSGGAGEGKGKGKGKATE
ncbi:MAG: hypothetical protein Q9183_002965 [Haloplaca sp. 2 TL-2023]